MPAGTVVHAATAMADSKQRLNEVLGEYDEFVRAHPGDLARTRRLSEAVEAQRVLTTAPPARRTANSPTNAQTRSRRAWLAAPEG